MIASTPQVQTFTAEELLRMPDDGFRHELVRGELRRMLPSGYEHGKIAMEIGWRLAQHVRAHNLGVICAAETGFVVATNPDTVRAPDVAFVSRERVEATGDVQGYWPGAPDLAVEVVSPGDTYTEVEEKALDWLDAGTRMVAVADPRKPTVTVYRSHDDITILTEEDTLNAGDVVPGWAMPVGELFA